MLDQKLYAVLVVLLLTSCATQQPTSEGSIKMDFDAPYGSVTAATRHSIEALNVNITNVHQGADVFTVQFKKPVSAWSWGEVGWAKVYPSATGQVTVEVSSKKVMGAQITGTETDEFAQAIFDGVKQALVDLASE